MDEFCNYKLESSDIFFRTWSYQYFQVRTVWLNLSVLNFKVRSFWLNFTVMLRCWLVSTLIPIELKFEVLQEAPAQWKLSFVCPLYTTGRTVQCKQLNPPLFTLGCIILSGASQFFIFLFRVYWSALIIPSLLCYNCILPNHPWRHCTSSQ